MQVTKDGMMVHYLMERRRILKDEVASIEKQLNIQSKEKALQDRIRVLEERLKP